MFEAVNNYHISQQQYEEKYDANRHENDAAVQQHQEDVYDALTSFHTQTLQLRRLLHCMSSTHAKASFHGEHGQGHVPNRILLEQMTDAQAMLHRIKVAGQGIIDHHSEDDHGHSHAAETVEILEYLESTVMASCHMLQEYLHHANSNVNVTNNDEKGGKRTVRNGNDYESSKRLIDHLFYDDMDLEESESDSESSILQFSDMEDEENDENPEEHVEPHKQKHKSRSISFSPKEEKLTSEQLQKQQEEMLEQEISEMANQLKKSSLNIKQTLKSQNEDLNEMETLVQENLDRTVDIKDKVTDQVKKGWSRSVGKWVTFFVVVGTCFFCMLTMRVVPKRQGACLFFCKNGEKGNTSSGSGSNSGSYFGGSQDYKRDDRNVVPKHSYCPDYENGKKTEHCSNPLEPHQHARKMGAAYPEADDEDLASHLAEENRDRRIDSNLKKAMKEADDVASQRVRDGWDSSDGGTGEDENLEDSDADEDDDDNYEEFDDTDDYYYGNEDESDWNDVASNDEEVIQNEKKDVVVDDEGVTDSETESDATYDHHYGEEDNEGVDSGTYDGDNDVQHEDAYDENEYKDDAHYEIQYSSADLIQAIYSDDIAKIRDVIKISPHLVNVKDPNGWTSLHEALRKGNAEIMSILIDEGRAELNDQVGSDGTGGNALFLAYEFHGADHPLIEVLESRGALLIGPIQIHNDEL